MATGIYTAFKNALGSGGINLTSKGQVKVAAFSDKFVFDDTNTMLSDINANQIGSGLPVVSPAMVGGYLTGSFVDFYDIPAGSVIAAIVLYFETGDPTTSTLIGYDTSAANLPYTADGTGIKIQYTNNQILKL